MFIGGYIFNFKTFPARVTQIYWKKKKCKNPHKTKHAK